MLIKKIKNKIKAQVRKFYPDIKNTILEKLSDKNLVNSHSQPSGNAEKVIPLYLLHNNKVLAYHISECLKKEILRQPIPSSPSKVGLTSKVSTQEDLESEWSRFWNNELKKDFCYHRKHWEQTFICQVLYEHGMLEQGKHGLGLACGKEPLPSFFIKKGCRITAGDKPDVGEDDAWKKGGQHTDDLLDLFYDEYIDFETFTQNIELKYIDCNNLPHNISGMYDFCWSVCAIEHFGSIQAGLDFLKNSIKLLKPGGISVHTTEFNYLDTPETIDNWGNVLFKKQHFTKLAEEVSELGAEVLALDFTVGDKIFDSYIDYPPHPLYYNNTLFCNMPESIKEQDVPHIKLVIDGFPSTCFGLIIRKK